MLIPNVGRNLTNIGKTGQPAGKASLIGRSLTSLDGAGSPFGAVNWVSAHPPLIELDDMLLIPVELLTGKFPAWFDVNSGDNPKQTGYYRILSALAGRASETLAACGLVDGQQWLDTRTQHYPRILWRCTVSDNAVSSGKEPELIIPGLREPLKPRKVDSQAALFSADDPVYIASEDGYYYFRNVAHIEEVVSSSTGSYKLSGKPIRDEAMWVLVGNQWQSLNVLEGSIDYDSAVVVVGDAGVIKVKYASQERLQSTVEQPCVYMDGEPPMSLTCHDLWNSYDEAALLAGIERISGEDNASLADRVKLTYRLTRKSREELVKSLIGQELGLVHTMEWDGESVVDLAALGYEHVTYITCLDIPKLKYAKDELLQPDYDNITFASSNKSWKDWSVYVNNTRVTTNTYPAMTVENGIVDFKEEVLGRVTASYTSELYTVELDPTQGKAVIRSTNDTPRDMHTLLFVTGVEATGTTDPELFEKLIDGDGLPTDTYLSVSNTVSSKVPVVVGVSSWGTSTHWFDDTEVTPQISHLPVVIK